MTIGVDFDGVVHKYSRGWQHGVIYDEPVEGSIEAVKETMAVEPVFIFTARDDLDAVAKWLSERGIPTITTHEWAALHQGHPTFWGSNDVVLVTNRKLPARAYLDDRAVKFGEGGWPQALQDLGVVISETIHTYLVTVKLPKNPEHDPRNKRVAACPANKGPGRAAVCTDHTGEHHTILVRSTRSSEAVALWAREHYGHVTRIEFADPITLE